MMNKLYMSAILAACAGLTACATSQQPANGGIAAAEAKQGNMITGSRIPARSTEKMVSAIDGKDYDQNARAQSTPFSKN